MKSFELFVSYVTIGGFFLSLTGLVLSMLWNKFNKEYKIVKKYEKENRKTGLLLKLEKENRIKDGNKVKIAHNSGIIDIRMSKETA